MLVALTLICLSCFSQNHHLIMTWALLSCGPTFQTRVTVCSGAPRWTSTALAEWWASKQNRLSHVVPAPKQFSISQVLSAGLLSSFESQILWRPWLVTSYDILWHPMTYHSRQWPVRGSATSSWAALTPRSWTKFTKSPSLSNTFEAIDIDSFTSDSMELTLPREVTQDWHQTFSEGLVSILSADPKAWCSLRKNSSIAPCKDLVISSDTTCYAHCDEAMHSKTERHASRGPAIKLLGRLRSCLATVFVLADVLADG